MAEPIEQRQYQTNIPTELMPYAQSLLGQAQAYTDVAQNPYQAYTGDQVAQFSPLQQQSYDYASQLQSAPQLQDATAMAGLAGLGGLNTQYTFKPSSFTSDIAKSMMSPYMQGVVDVQKRAAERDKRIADQQRQAQAVNAGAFGGARDLVGRNLANAELQRNLQGIQATGLQNAYQQAMQQYNTQYGQNAQQQQFGAGLGMQGLGLANQAAANLGALGQTQYGQNVGLIGLQNQLGLQQQQQAQNVLNTQYQNFLNAQNYPFKQMGFMSDIIRGTPLTQTGASVYQAAPTAMQNLTSLGLGAYGLSSLFGSKAPGSAEGGQVKSYAYGGSVMSPGFKRYAVDHIDPRQLPIAQRNAQARGDLDTNQFAMQEMADDAALRRGLTPALPAGVDIVRAAGGGILAFQSRGLVEGSEGEGEGDGDFQVQTNDISAGNPGLQRLFGNKMLEVIQRLEGNRGYIPPTAQDYENAENKEFTRLQQLGGPDPYVKALAGLEQQDRDRATGLEQGKGLAALKAAAAVLQPGGFMRGLGAAGSAFADSYGQALAADKAEKRFLSQMQFNYADAQRKEKLGLFREARQNVQNAEGNKLNAYKASILKDQAIGNMLGRGMMATRPTGGAGGANKIKLAEQLSAAEVALALDPENKQKQATLEAIRRAADRMRSSELGPTKTDVETGKLDVSREAKAAQAWEDMGRDAKKAFAKENGITVGTANPGWREQARKKYTESFSKKPATSGGGGGSAPPPPPGFQRPQQ